METKYIAFYVDLPHKDFTQLTKHIVEHYTIDEYLITAEKSVKGIEHYHFLIHSTQNIYAAIMQKLKSDYSLIGKAGKDGRRAYGKMRKIQNLDRLKIYMLKDWKEWNLLYTNIDKKKIEQLHALSFKKNEKFARIEILKKNFQELLKKKYEKNREIIDNLDYSSVIAQNQNYSLDLKRTLAKCALKIWTIKEDLRPPLMNTLLCYARPIIGEDTFMEHYYNL